MRLADTIRRKIEIPYGEEGVVQVRIPSLGGREEFLEVLAGYKKHFDGVQTDDEFVARFLTLEKGAIARLVAIVLSDSNDRTFTVDEVRKTSMPLVPFLEAVIDLWEVEALVGFLSRFVVRIMELTNRAWTSLGTPPSPTSSASGTGGTSAPTSGTPAASSTS